tara:strand:- start:1157 stop:1957 length:801 start_codon:yes stop_codon:yes gene_type:complete
MENPSKSNRKKKKKDVKVVRRKPVPSQVISQKVSIRIGDQATKQRKRKKTQPKKRKEPFVVYAQTPIPLFVPPQVSPPPPTPLRPPEPVPQFTPRSLNEQVASREDVASQVDIPSREELKAKEKEKVAVSFKKINVPETAYDRVKPQLAVGRNLLNDVVDEMTREILKEELKPKEDPLVEEAKRKKAQGFMKFVSERESPDEQIKVLTFDIELQQRMEEEKRRKEVDFLREQDRRQHGFVSTSKTTSTFNNLGLPSGEEEVPIGSE